MNEKVPLRQIIGDAATCTSMKKRNYMVTRNTCLSFIIFMLQRHLTLYVPDMYLKHYHPAQPKAVYINLRVKAILHRLYLCCTPYPLSQCMNIITGLVNKCVTIAKRNNFSFLMDFDYLH